MILPSRNTFGIKKTMQNNMDRKNANTKKTLKNHKNLNTRKLTKYNKFE